MLGSQCDEVVPPAHMRSLWNTANAVNSACGQTRKGKFIEFPEGRHSTLDKTIVYFLGALY